MCRGSGEPQACSTFNGCVTSSAPAGGGEGLDRIHLAALGLPQDPLQQLLPIPRGLVELREGPGRQERRGASPTPPHASAVADSFSVAQGPASSRGVVGQAGRRERERTCRLGILGRRPKLHSRTRASSPGLKRKHGSARQGAMPMPITCAGQILCDPI